MKTLLIQSLQTVLLRDLDKLAEEISQYPSEESLWKVAGSIKNPAGNLCLHLCGNLQHFIGAVLGKTNYKRNRDHEFAAKNITRENLLLEIANTKKAIEKTVPTLTEEHLKSNYPQDVFGRPMTTLFFLVHLSTHFSYHLGQVNYHRRLVAVG